MGEPNGPDGLDPLQLVRHLQRQWKTPAIACAVAVLLALAVSLLAPVRYTAVSRIFIESPAGSDVRASVAVSPVYLESLRTYEHFAASDSLFYEALKHFDLRRSAPDRSIETWKKKVLDVRIPSNTRILEISTTLEDPVKAQKMAQFLAERTVQLSAKVSRASDADVIADLAELLAEAESRLERAEAEWTKYLASSDADKLTADIEELRARRYRISRSLDEAELRPASGTVEQRRRQLAELQSQIERRENLVSVRAARRQELNTEVDRARSQYETAGARYQDLMGSRGLRGERLRVIDPGIVPERPSSPNMPLNLIAAFLFALIGSTALLCLRFGLRRDTRETRATVVSLRAKARND